MLASKVLRIALALAALLLALPALAADVTFSGQVTYRQRMALPPGSDLTVTLVGLPGEQRVASARASLGGKAGSPIQLARAASNCCTNIFPTSRCTHSSKIVQRNFP